MSLVCAWHGEIADIPTGWHLCDGQEGTVDLRDLFIIGAGGLYGPGATGGAVTHTHTFTAAGHDHDMVGGDEVAAGPDFDETVTSEIVTGTTDPASSLGPYYALAWIEKL